MRSEKVYHLTNLINQKLAQLKQEKDAVQGQYEDHEVQNDFDKKHERQLYQDLKAEKDAADNLLQAKIMEIMQLEMRTRQMKKR